VTAKAMPHEQWRDIAIERIGAGNRFVTAQCDRW
jgi:hypothetical protein